MLWAQHRHSSTYGLTRLLLIPQPTDEFQVLTKFYNIYNIIVV